MKKLVSITLLIVIVFISQNRNISSETEQPLNTTKTVNVSSKSSYHQTTLVEYERYSSAYFSPSNNIGKFDLIPKNIKDEIIAKSEALYPDSYHFQNSFINSEIESYLRLHPYLFKVKSKLISICNQKEIKFQCCFYRNIHKDQMKLIVMSELEELLKNKKEFVDGVPISNIIDNIQVIEAYGFTGDIDTGILENSPFEDRFYYVQDLKKILNADDFTAYKISKEKKGELIYPSFSEVCMQKDFSGKIRFIGKTNLPEKFQLCVSLRQAGVYYDNMNTEVNNGKFITRWFNLTDQQQGLYEVEIGSPISELQPKSVQAIIGNKGQNLYGENIILSPLGSCKCIRYKLNWKYCVE